MAYDRFDARRDRERGRFSDFDRDRGRDEDRGFFDRAGDEIASWFGDEEAERRRREDERMNRGWGHERDSGGERYRYGGWGGEPDRERYAYRGSTPGRDRGRFSDESRRPRSTREHERTGYGGYEHDLAPGGYGTMPINRGYSPGYVGGFGYTGGYGSDTTPSYGYGEGTERGYGSSGWGGAFTGSDYERGDRDYDRDYRAWRQRQLNELDRDYDEFRRENRERFEREFGTWRESRQQKRQMLGQIREHMDVVGSDGEAVGKVDCVRRDRIVLTKSDSPDNRHHSLSCGMIDTVEGDQVRLDIPAEEAKSRWRDEEHDFFRGEREAEGTNLERSFAGTYDR